MILWEGGRDEVTTVDQKSTVIALKELWGGGGGGVPKQPRQTNYCNSGPQEEGGYNTPTDPPVRERPC